MSITLHLKPKEVWQFFSANRPRLMYEPVPIAECDGGATIMLRNSYGVVQLDARNAQGSLLATATAGEANCADVCARFYRNHLIAPVREQLKKQQPEKKEETRTEDEPADCGELQDFMDSSYEREDALRLAMLDFLQVATTYPTHEDILQEITEEDVLAITEDLCKTLTEFYGLRIYWPQAIEQENGEIRCLDYPFELEEDQEPPAAAPAKQ